MGQYPPQHRQGHSLTTLDVQPSRLKIKKVFTAGVPLLLSGVIKLTLRVAKETFKPNAGRVRGQSRDKSATATPEGMRRE